MLRWQRASIEVGDMPDDKAISYHVDGDVEDVHANPGITGADKYVYLFLRIGVSLTTTACLEPRQTLMVSTPRRRADCGGRSTSTSSQLFH